jgi:NAD dependent epimerase/dehydratase family enzyme
MSDRRVTVTGATGLLGPRLIRELQGDGWEVTVLTRDPDKARARLDGVEAVRWDLMGEPAPAAALEGRAGVIHLAGENVAQRWSASAKRAIRESRVLGTEHLLEGLRAVELGMRVLRVRTGVVLDRDGGALEKMLPPFKLGVGGPVAGGRQYIAWVHADDVVGIMAAALADERWSGAANATAPVPVTNSQFSKALGRVLHRPSLLPVPGAALKALYGEMSEIVTSGARVVPAKPLMLGYAFRHPELEEALRSALSG